MIHKLFFKCETTYLKANPHYCVLLHSKILSVPFIHLFTLGRVQMKPNGPSHGFICSLISVAHRGFSFYVYRFLKGDRDCKCDLTDFAVLGDEAIP